MGWKGALLFFWMGLFLQNGQDVLFSDQQQILLSLILKLSAAILSEQDAISDLHHRGDGGAVLVECSGASGQHESLVALLDCRVRQHNAAHLVYLRLDPSDHNAIEQGEDSGSK